MQEEALAKYFVEMGQYPLLSRKDELMYAEGIEKLFSLLLNSFHESMNGCSMLIEHWQKLYNTGKPTGRLSSRYGERGVSVEDLSAEINLNMSAARGFYWMWSNIQETEPSRDLMSMIRERIELSNISREVYFKLAMEHAATVDFISIQAALANRIKSNRDMLVKSNLRLVINFAKKFQGMGVPLSDLIQEGNIGLIRASEKFNPALGHKFSTYAAWWIRQGFIKAVKKQGKVIRLPSYIHDKISSVYKTWDELAYKLGRDPTLTEVAEIVKVSEVELEKLMSLQVEPLQLDTPLSKDTDGASVRDFIPAPLSDPADDIDQEQLNVDLRDSFDSFLTDEEQKVLILRFGLWDKENHTLDQIADLLGKSRERIRQIEAAAKEKLKEGAGRLLDHHREK